MMDKSDKTASLPKSINLNTWSVNKGKNKKYVVVCGAVLYMEGCRYIDR
jgi:hypothetical protein